MKTIKTTLCVLLALCTLAGMCSCSFPSSPLPVSGDSSSGTGEPSAVSDIGGESSDPAESDSGESGTVSEPEQFDIPPALNRTGFPTELNAYKIGKIGSSTRIEVASGGLVYRTDDGKIGFMDFDGKNQTEAKYLYSTYATKGNYFRVSEKKLSENAEDLAGINIYGLVDVRDTTLIPQQYALIEVLNDRFAVATAVTAITEDQDAALVYLTSNMFSIVPGEGDIFYTGEWTVYDLQAKKPVPGLTGTNRVTITSNGSYIGIAQRGGETKYYDAAGAELATGKEYVSLCDNGCYRVQTDSAFTVYDENRQALFTLDPDVYYISGSTGDYFLVEKINDTVTYKVTYYLYDRTGKQVSATFDGMCNVEGKYVHSDSKLYDFSGKLVIDKDAYWVRYDSGLTGNCWAIRSQDGSYTYIDENGKILFEGTEDDSHEIYDYDFVASRKDGDTKSFYCYKDGDYTVTGESFYALAPFIVNDSRNGKVIDTISGKTLIEGASSMCSASVAKDGKVYVYARNEKNETLIYVVQ